MKIAPALLLLLLSISTLLFAQQSNSRSNHSSLWEPLVIEWPSTLPPATIPNPMIISFHLTDMHIALEETSLESAREHFGGVIGHKGDAGESLHWLCVEGTDPNGRWLMWLESSEVDGGDIGGFQWRRIASKTKVDRRCPRLGVGQSIELPIPLRLGMTGTEVRRVLGHPTLRHRNTLIFDHKHDTLVIGARFTVSNTVAVVFNGNVVSAIQVWNTSVN